MSKTKVVTGGLDQTGSFDFTSGLTLGDNLLFDASSKGVYIGVTSATAANLLDDFEEGTFTPTLTGASSNPSSISYNTQTGNYTKVGNVVHIDLILYPSSFSGGSGSLRIAGLPFAAAQRATGAVQFDRIRIQADKPTTVVSAIEGTVSYVNLVEMFDASNENAGNVDIDDLAGNVFILTSFSYKTS